MKSMHIIIILCDSKYSLQTHCSAAQGCSSLMFQLSAGLEAEAGVSYGFLNLGCGHVEPAVPDPKGTVHGCPVVWSPLRAGMPVHSSGGDSQLLQI